MGVMATKMDKRPKNVGQVITMMATKTTKRSHQGERGQLGGSEVSIRLRIDSP